MDRRFKPAVAALILIVDFAGSLAGAGRFEDGVDAARRADYATVVRLWRPLAEQGDARAQSSLASMYENGRGVPKDFVAAASWYQRAAAQGDVGAQLNLGLIYAKGHGVPQDYVSAYMWFDLAAATGEKIAERYRDQVAVKLTPSQLSEGRGLRADGSPSPRPRHRGCSGDGGRANSHGSPSTEGRWVRTLAHRHAFGRGRAGGVACARSRRAGGETLRCRAKRAHPYGLGR